MNDSKQMAAQADAIIQLARQVGTLHGERNGLRNAISAEPPPQYNPAAEPHELGGVPAPVLLLWGDRDAYAVRADQEALMKAMPTARLVTLEGTGHAIHWEEPERVVAELVDFVFSRS